MGTVTVSLRPATTADGGAVWQIFSPILTEGTTYAQDERMEQSDFLHDWFGRGGEQWMAETERGLVGAYTLRPNHPGRGSHVATASYGVDASARGLRVGTAMGRHSLQRAQAAGYAAIQFNFVVSTNTAAVRLGFEVVATLPAAFQHRLLGLVDAYVMWRGLK
jgi:ribosomal protein S18 acetylase RimI-like enzyme